jgi:hypothetical protein
MSETPRTDEAVERWRQGKINLWEETARLERELRLAQKEIKELREERDLFRKMFEKSGAWHP